MRYNADSGKILISNREFVATARRGIAASVPSDSDEPEVLRLSRRILSGIIGEAAPQKISFDFECGGYSFTLTAKAERADGCKLWFATEVDSNPMHPKKEYISELRGEGYVAAYAYAKANDLDRVNLNFIYINSKTSTHAKTEETAPLSKLEKFFKKCASAVAVYAKPEIDRVTIRTPSMKSLKFPYKSARDGQREFVHRAYKSIARGGTLFATAPTGTGKTVSALYPAVRAMGDGLRDKTFYLTPKETTTNAAIECLELMAERGAVIRGIKLTAKEKCSKILVSPS